MTEEEAKYTIIEYMPIMGFPKYRQALRMAINTLEKQIAKKVYEGHFYREPFPIYRCPMCPNTVLERNQEYCQCCGQKLDWSEV
jgi:hypothetical protein